MQGAARHVVGSEKMVVYNDLATEERIRVFDKGVVLPDEGPNLQEMPMSYRYGEIRSPYVAGEEPLSVQDREFLSCVMDGGVPGASGDSGLAVVRALECANASLQRGGPVYLDPEPELNEGELRLAGVR